MYSINSFIVCQTYCEYNFFLYMYIGTLQRGCVLICSPENIDYQAHDIYIYIRTEHKNIGPLLPKRRPWHGALNFHPEQSRIINVHILETQNYFLFI